LASRRPRGKRFSQGGRGPKNQLWTVVVQDEINLGAAGDLESQIVLGSDWERASGSLESATCMSIRGWVSLQSRITAGVASGPGVLHMYIGVFDEDETPPGAELASTYGDEIIMWTGGHTFGGAAAAADVDQHYDVMFDVKVQRKITNGKKVSLVFSNGLTTGVLIGGVQRALVRLGGN